MHNLSMTETAPNGKPAAIDPRSPCPHPPGSAGKIAWLRARAARQLPLFLDCDLTPRRGSRTGIRRARLALGIAI